MNARNESGLWKPAALMLLSALLAACSTTAPQRPTDPDTAAAAKRGQRAFRSGRYEAAAGAFSAALQRARMLNEKAGTADSAYNLAACFVAMGRYEEARVALREATAELGPADPGLADALLLEGAIARRQERRDEALALADRVLAMKAAETRKLQAHLLRLETRCDAGAGDAESPDLSAALRAASDAKISPDLRAAACSAIGRVLSVQRQPAPAADRYDAAAALFRQAARPRDVAAALTRAGRCLEEAGTPAAAADRYYRAARSLFAQNDFAESVKALDSACAMAEKAADPEMKARAGDLLLEVQAAIRAAEPGK